MNWKRVISGVLAAAMLSALPVQLLVSAEGTEAVGQADGWQKLTTLESLDESNTFFYSKDDQTFEKITHPEKDVKTADGIVDYLGDGAVAVVTDSEDAAYNAGDRGQNYAWSAVGYGDWLYVGTCYAAIGNTLSLMKSSLGDEYDDKVLAATFDALYNGTFFLTEEDGGRPKGVLVKINTKTGETKVLMSGSYNGYTPLFRNALEYNGKLYFCGSVGGGGIGFLPSIWQVDPATDECKPVYIGLNSVQDYAAAYQQGISVGIRGMCVYKDQLVVSNVTMDAATGKSSAALLISSDPEKGFTQIADSDSLFNYPAYHYADSIYGGSIWDMAEFNGRLYVSICTGTEDNMPDDNTMQSFALVRGDQNPDGTFTWTPVAGDQEKRWCPLHLRHRPGTHPLRCGEPDRVQRPPLYWRVQRRRDRTGAHPLCQDRQERRRSVWRRAGLPVHQRQSGTVGEPVPHGQGREHGACGGQCHQDVPQRQSVRAGVRLWAQREPVHLADAGV